MYDYDVFYGVFDIFMQLPALEQFEWSQNL